MKKLALLFLLFTSASVQAAAPTFVAAGAESTNSVALPAGTTTDDILLIIAHSSNQSIATPFDWTEIDSQTHMAGGTAATAGANRIAVFWKRHDGSEASVSMTNPGNHIETQMLAFRGCETSGNPYSDVGTAYQSANNSYMAWASFNTTQWLNGSSQTPTGVFNTTVNDSFVIFIMGHAVDSTNPDVVFPAGTFLTGMGQLTGADHGTNTGTGGGFGVGGGTMTTAGNIFAGTYQINVGGSWTVNGTMMILAFKPPTPGTPTPVPANVNSNFLPF